MTKKIFSILIVCLFLISLFPDEIFATRIPPSPDIQSPAAILMDADSGVIIYSRNMNDRYYPASITKIMTSLLAIEMADGDFNQRVHFSHSAVNSIPLGAAHISMGAGDTLSLREALMGHMLVSANEVSNAIGEHFSVTTEEFSRLMSARAGELGATNTNFTNPHGLHGANHYTTALDMALVMREAIQHPEFIDIISTQSFQVPPTERSPQPRNLNQQHRMTQPGHYFFREYVVGGKTGFTTPARNTLVTYARRDGIGLIAVVLHNDGAARSYEDTAKLFEFGFNMFGQIMIFDASDFSYQISVVEPMEGGSIAETAMIDVYARENVLMNLPINLQAQDIRREVVLPDYLNPPVLEGDRVGSIRLMYMNSELATVPLFAANEAFSSLQAIEPSTRFSGLGMIEEGIGSPIGLQTILSTGFIIIIALTVCYIFVERARRRRKRMLVKLRRERKMRGNTPHYGYYGAYKNPPRANSFRYKTDNR